MLTGVTGLLANAEDINVIGNNLANVNTIGFKSSRTLFSDLLSTNIGNGSQIGRGTQIQKVDNIISQSSFDTTEITSDVAIQGSAFFVLESTTGSQYVTRAGAFRMNEDGLLVNPDGYFVLDEGGAQIDLGVGSTITSIDSEGEITYVNAANATQTYATKIGVATIPNVGALQKSGGTLYDVAASEAAGSGTITPTAADGVINKIYSNSLEASNVDMASQFVRLIQTQQAYTANSKTITTANEMTDVVLNLIR
jgi:flagellar hook protein FlgE